MLTNPASLLLGGTFVLVGAANVWLILQATAQLKDTRASARLVAAHRIGGYLFITLFLLMAYFMMARLGNPGSATPETLIHLTLALILTPLLFLKVLIARYYRSYYGLLMPIGLVIFVGSFVLVAITSAPYLAHQARVETVSLAAINLPPAAIDLDLAAGTMQKRCSRCHNLDRVIGARKDARGWQATVNRMRSLPGSGISEEDSRLIVSYLASQVTPKGSPAVAELEVGRALVDQRCKSCHSLDRVYAAAKTPEEWSATVARMTGYAAGSGVFQAGDDRRILAYLSATQTPEAVKRRAIERATATPATPQTIAPTDPAPRGSDFKMAGFLSLVGLSMGTLLFKRPARAPVTDAKAGPRARPAEDAPSREPLLLRLASITPRTSDSKTLRFTVCNGKQLNARPGQFLSFTFLFDGQKVTRCYSICSSTARSGYVEITPKRVKGGCVSVFLNDRAQVGMTVEARGPSGRFFFDESRQQNVVMIAAGSGITPMIAMLRYMDDLCLETRVTLLYCVRTREDIMFSSELAALRARLKNFHYVVCLSQGDAGWSGPRGHISRELVERTVSRMEGVDFFLCGPPAFMESGHGILTALGVKPERIRQESFGGAAKSGSSPAVAAESRVEFVRSSKTCLLKDGQTLLEAAEEHGVAIPFSCRQGQCGTCKTRLLEGQVKMDAEAGLDPDSRQQGFVLTCVGHAEGQVRLDA